MAAELMTCKHCGRAIEWVTRRASNQRQGWRTGVDNGGMPQEATFLCPARLQGYTDARVTHQPAYDLPDDITNPYEVESWLKS